MTWRVSLVARFEGREADVLFGTEKNDKFRAITEE